MRCMGWSRVPSGGSGLSSAGLTMTRQMEVEASRSGALACRLRHRFKTTIIWERRVIIIQYTRLFILDLARVFVLRLLLLLFSC
jgi:hypothetical protein